ncbi:unnamed protein product [Lymnaea stagnalis]|uniref:Uncharacterized protein n=1 Tax=Lymnaea stagnalis TaxID=6523 RepID=A0AAV2ILR6_LYMST
MSTPSVIEKQAVITKMCGSSWTSLLLCSFFVQFISGHLTTMGTEFVVAVPKMRLTNDMENVSSIHFLLTTLSANNVEVQISTPHYSRYESNGESLNETIIVGGNSGVTYDLDARFQSNPSIQIVSGSDDNFVIFKFVVLKPRLSVLFFNYTRMETGGNHSFTLRRLYH